MVQKIAELLLVSCLLGASFSSAQQQVDEEAYAQRFKALTIQLRCPKCQNQDLADSNAGVAADLRNQIKTMIMEGKSDQEIIDFMVDRYGEFVLYKPRFSGWTLVVWLAPVALLILAGMGLVWVLKKNRSLSAEKVSLLNHEEKQQKLKDLLQGKQ